MCAHASTSMCSAPFLPHLTLATVTVRYHAPMQHDAWPPLPYDAWKDTYATLHMWTQVVGKVALAQAPPLNHCVGQSRSRSPLAGSRRGRCPHGDRSFTIAFDFIDHQLVIEPSDGGAHAAARAAIRRGLLSRRDGDAGRDGDCP